MITSKLSARAQTVLPTAVRQHLRVGPGDEVVYDISRPGEVRVRALARTPLDDPFAPFDEWSSAEDEAAYADLTPRGAGSR